MEALRKELCVLDRPVRVYAEHNGTIWFCVWDLCNAMRRPNFMLNNPIFTMCADARKIKFNKNKESIWGIQKSDVVKYFYLSRNESKSMQTRYATLVDWTNNLTLEDIFPKPTNTTGELDTANAGHTANESLAESVLKVFAHPDFGNIRSTVKDDEVWFCLADICKAVELTSSSKVRGRLDDDDVQLVDLHALKPMEGGTPSPSNLGNAKANFVNESGLYATILHSCSPKVKPFKKWVTHEVLPSIRKTGAYVIATQNDTPEVIIARGLMAAKEALDRMEERALRAEGSLAKAKPKVDYYDAVIGDRNLYTTYQIAGELGLSYVTLRSRLFNLGVVTSPNGKMELTNNHFGWGDNNAVLKGKTGLKWNKEGRKGIFSLISPELPM